MLLLLFHTFLSLSLSLSLSAGVKQKKKKKQKGGVRGQRRESKKMMGNGTRKKKLKNLRSQSLFELKQHVVVRGEPAAGPKHVLEGCPLARESVDNGGPLGHKRSFGQIRQKRRDGVHRSKVFVLAFFLERDASEQLCDDDEVEDDGGREERVLAGVVHDDGGFAALERKV